MIHSTTEHRPESASPARTPFEHKVKSWPSFFEATLSGVKTHEVRRLTDRDYQVGDRLLLQEYDPSTETYSGRELAVRITYVTSTEAPCALSEECLHPHFCILSIVKE
ncbi:DUF3850 domain-containing protein [Bradyrhizobium sp. CW10]|nr:DUF3850 domain-containing protein [Bradyrhizobium sp. CW10]